MKQVNITKYINKFMFQIIHDKSSLDYLHTSDSKLIFSLLSESAITENNKDIIINSKTTILSFPNNLKKVNYILNSIVESGFNFESLAVSEYFLYIYDLDMLIMQEGASHRLAALYLYVKRYPNETIIIKKRYIKFMEININCLLELKVNSSKNKLYHLDEKKYKYIYHLKSIHTMNFVIELQRKYLRRINKLSFFEGLKFKFIYNYSPITILQNRINNKLYNI